MCFGGNQSDVSLWKNNTIHSKSWYTDWCIFVEKYVSIYNSHGWYCLFLLESVIIKPVFKRFVHCFALFFYLTGHICLFGLCFMQAD